MLVKKARLAPPLRAPTPPPAPATAPVVSRWFKLPTWAKLVGAPLVALALVEPAQAPAPQGPPPLHTVLSLATHKDVRTLDRAISGLHARASRGEADVVDALARIALDDDATAQVDELPRVELRARALVALGEALGASDDECAALALLSRVEPLLDDPELRAAAVRAFGAAARGGRDWAMDTLRGRLTSHDALARDAVLPGLEIARLRLTESDLAHVVAHALSSSEPGRAGDFVRNALSWRDVRAKAALVAVLRAPAEGVDARLRQERAAALLRSAPAFLSEDEAVAVRGASLADVADPFVRGKHQDDAGKPTLVLERFVGPLAVDGAAPNDVIQGSLADCYLNAALSSAAKTHGPALLRCITDHYDGTYTVKYFERSPRGPVQRSMKIDGDLYVFSKGGGPAYGQSATPAGKDAHKSMELWFALLEKAYAQKHGGYKIVGDAGGWAADVLFFFLGGNRGYHSVQDSDAETVWGKIREAGEKGWPMVAGTLSKEHAAKLVGTGVHAWHAYSVLGTELEDGKRYVRLRNPWGSGEEDGHGGLRVELSVFMKAFSSLSSLEVGGGTPIPEVVHPPKPPPPAAEPNA